MTQQTPVSPAVNYERHFVPTIGAPLAHDLVDRARLVPGQRVLDVACGTGVVARLAAERVGASAVAGVDVNPGMLEVARGGDHGTGIEWHEASVEALPLADATFDVVLCQLALQFFPDRRGALREMHRVLAPGGRILLNVPGPTPAMFRVAEEALRRHVGADAAGFVATVFSLHAPEDVTELLRAAGFVDARAASTHWTLTAPETFFWEYVSSTPLAAAVAGVDEEARAALHDEVEAGWARFAEDGRLALDVDLTTGTARRA